MIDIDPSAVPPAAIAAFRSFNRFLTSRVGVLDEGILASPYSLPQARVLYELANSDDLSAADLTRQLSMDPAYASRLISALAAENLLEKRPDPDHGRRLTLSLTEKGRSVAAELDRASSAEAAKMLAPLSKPDLDRFLEAIGRIRRLLDAQRPGAMPTIFRDPAPGDLGYVASRQTKLYAEQYGWNWEFEAMLCELMATFVRNFEPSREKCWIAENDGEIVGSVFVVRESAESAKLRMLYVEPRMQGQGLGRQLIDESVRFARGVGYRHMTLWTNDILHAARHLYVQAGFRLLREEPHHSFGQDLVGQYWQLDL